MSNLASISALVRPSGPSRISMTLLKSAYSVKYIKGYMLNVKGEECLLLSEN